MSAILCGGVAVWRLVMVCRRLLGPLDRAVIMAGLEAGLSQVFTPRQISAPLARGGVWHTAPEPPSATPPPHSTNSSLPPIDTTGCYEQYPRSVRTNCQFFAIARKDWLRRSNAMLGRCGRRTPRCVRRDRMSCAAS